MGAVLARLSWRRARTVGDVFCVYMSRGRGAIGTAGCASGLLTTFLHMDVQSSPCRVFDEGREREPEAIGSGGAGGLRMEDTSGNGSASAVSQAERRSLMTARP